MPCHIQNILHLDEMVDTETVPTIIELCMGINTYSYSRPLFGFRSISFWSWISFIVNFSTSPIRIPPLAINSSIRRLRGLHGPKNNLIDGLFFDDVPVSDFRGFKQLFHHRNSTRVFKAFIQVGFNEKLHSGRSSQNWVVDKWVDIFIRQLKTDWWYHRPLALIEW